MLEVQTRHPPRKRPRAAQVKSSRSSPSSWRYVLSKACEQRLWPLCGRLWHAEDFFPSKRIAICTQTQAASETAAGLVSKVCIGNGRRLPGLCTTGLRLKDEVGGRGATSCNVAHAHPVFRTSRLCSEALGTPTECLALDLQKAGTSIRPNRQNPGSLLKTQNKGNTHTHARYFSDPGSAPRGQRNPHNRQELEHAL